jgi:FixJ family two-component response regulator
MPLAKKVIAILDDEPAMRKALHRLLTSCGFHVEDYESGEELIAASGSNSLDCLLLDLHMPGLNGFDVLETWRSRRIAVPVIVITAYDEPGMAERVLALGASAYLKKPAEKQALLAAIEAANQGT